MKTKDPHAQELARKRAASLSPERRREIAKKAAETRWKNKRRPVFVMETPEEMMRG